MALLKMENEMTECQLRIFENQDGDITIEVRLADETVSMRQAQMGELFGKVNSGYQIWTLLRYFAVPVFTA